MQSDPNDEAFRDQRLGLLVQRGDGNPSALEVLNPGQAKWVCRLGNPKMAQQLTFNTTTAAKANAGGLSGWSTCDSGDRCPV